tara:strand:- start:149040 stop:151559 length:2520 start_codon:yes stop_codon:yes gene_type:complete
LNNFSSLISLFSNQFPELEDLSIKVNGIKTVFNDFDRLMPFLTYTNTLDEENRLIFLTHSKSSTHYKLLPFYIILSVLKKQIDRIDTSTINRFKNLEFIYKGSFCRINSVDLLQNCVVTNNNQYKKIPFIEFTSYEVAPVNSRETPLLDSLKGIVQLIESQNIKNIYGLLNCVNSLTTKPKGGLLVFTGKSKFELLCNNIEIGNGNRSYPLKTWIPIQKAVYKKRKQNYEYQWLDTFSHKYPIVVYADYSDIGAIDLFLEKYDYLDTVVFDDADKGSNHFKIIDHLNTYKMLQNGSDIRDIYLISSISSQQFHKQFEAEKSKSYNWSTLYNIDYSKYYKEFKHIIIDDDQFVEYYEALNEKIARLKNVKGHVSFELLAPLFTKIYEIRSRLNSFYNPEALGVEITEYEKILDDFLEKSGIAYLLKDLFEEIKTTLRILYNLGNNKLSKLTEIILKEPDNELITVSSSNENEQDIEYLKSKIKGTNLQYINSKDGRLLDDKRHHAIFLDFRPPITDVLFLQDLAEKVTMLLYPTESGFYHYKFKSNLEFIRKSIRSSKFSSILNLSNQEPEVNNLKIGVSKELSNKLLQSFRSKPKPEENSITEVLSEVYSSSASKGIGERNPNDLLIWFSDGDYLETSKGSFFYKADDGDIDDLSELRVEANELKVGDIIFIKQSENRSLRDEIYRTIQKNDYFSPKLKKAEQWRGYLKVLISTDGIDSVHNLLKRNGMKEHKITIQNWESGRTILPVNIKKLIGVLNEHATKSINKTLHIELDIVNDAREMKSLIVSLPKLLLKKTISEQMNIEGFEEAEDKRTRELINQLSRKVNVKEIINILKIPN